MAREPRTKLSKTLDIMKPITISMLGTDHDPCFGKHFDGANKSCRRCGDSELCLIGMGQRNNHKRKALEAKGGFKDISAEEFLVDSYKVHEYLVYKLKDLGTPISPNLLLKSINRIFYNNTGEKPLIKKLMKAILKQSICLDLVKINNKHKIIFNGKD